MWAFAPSTSQTFQDRHSYSHRHNYPLKPSELLKSVLHKMMNRQERDSFLDSLPDVPRLSPPCSFQHRRVRKAACLVQVKIIYLQAKRLKILLLYANMSFACELLLTLKVSLSNLVEKFRKRRIGAVESINRIEDDRKVLAS